MPWPKAVGLLALEQGAQLTGCPGRASPKICTPATPSLAKSLPLEPLRFPNNTLQLHFDFGEGLGSFPPSPLRTGKKCVHFKPPRFARCSPPVSDPRVVQVIQMQSQPFPALSWHISFVNHVPTSNRSRATASPCFHLFSVRH